MSIRPVQIGRQITQRTRSTLKNIPGVLSAGLLHPQDNLEECSALAPSESLGRSVLTVLHTGVLWS
jgi:hypothetical protein